MQWRRGQFLLLILLVCAWCARKEKLKSTATFVCACVISRFAEEGAKVVLSSRKQDQVNGQLIPMSRLNLKLHSNTHCIVQQVDEQVKILRARGLSVAGKACHQGRAADREALIKFTVQTYGKIDSVALCVGIQPGGRKNCACAACACFLSTNDISNSSYAPSPGHWSHT